MDNIERERELAFEWRGASKIVNSLKQLDSWDQERSQFTIIDTIYDTSNLKLGDQKIGVRVRTKGKETNLTIKKFLGKGINGESLYDECHQKLSNSVHPDSIRADSTPLLKNIKDLVKHYTFTNRRQQMEFRKNESIVRLINEKVTYANNNVVTENLLEVEFEGPIGDQLIGAVKKEIQDTYAVTQIHEGKSDRARRLLEEAGKAVTIQNIKNVSKQTMHAHGGEGLIDMWFFHQPYSRFDKDTNIPAKAFDYKSVNWDLFAYAELPVGAEVKVHRHNSTDEIYFIMSGSATITVDGTSMVIGEGDCILTRKGSAHALSLVTETLKFIAIEVHRQDEQQ